MPKVDWTMEQRAAVRRYTLITAVLCAIGAALSVFLIASGNSGGWVLMGIAGVAALGLYLIRLRGGRP